MCTSGYDVSYACHSRLTLFHQERALARARSKEWHTRVTVAAKKIADAEARGLRPPMSNLHRRSAERLRDLCSVNGGVYVRNVSACCVLRRRSSVKKLYVFRCQSGFTAT